MELKKVNIVIPNNSKKTIGSNRNSIHHSYGPSLEISNFIVESNNPLIINDGQAKYLITDEANSRYLEDFDYALLVTKKDKRKKLSLDQIFSIEWIKNPNFKEINCSEVIDSWVDSFHFKTENLEKGILGLRNPQIGALHAILSHNYSSNDRAIIVMPTGTGKTETMIAALTAIRCKKLLISVPSDSLRSQIFEKFLNLGLVRELGIIDTKALNPIIGLVNHKFNNIEEFAYFTDKCNVVVTTMTILSSLSSELKSKLNDTFSHFFVDEAHHSEASSWRQVIEYFDKSKTYLFTATPFRNDEKALQGKIIFNFSLKKAQEQGYYKTIKFIPIREYNRQKADKEIAEVAVSQLKKDRQDGYNHILLARCVSRKRAEEVFEYYRDQADLHPILLHSGISNINDKIEQIKKGNHAIIVCVNMLGEGFDLPALKIAAVHDERQSLPITLQFIGRFTRSSFEELGNPSFVTNIAYPPINHEIEQLYARNADWNLILPRISKNATEKEINIREFLTGFKRLNDSQIPFEQINPPLSATVYRSSALTWAPQKDRWERFFFNFDHVFGDTNHDDTLVIILGKIEKTVWGKFETIQNLMWDIVIVHWDSRPGVNRVFVNSSLNQFNGKFLLEAVFGADTLQQITGPNLFRIFHDVNRLSLFNVGTRTSLGKDITFQSYFGRGVQDGISQIEQGNLIKNNIFGTGYQYGEKLSLGCSIKGKVWSYKRGNLSELIQWFKEIGDKIENEDINPNVVLDHTLKMDKIYARPNEMPIMIDWNPDVYKNIEKIYSLKINGIAYNFSDVELTLVNPSNAGDIAFSVENDSFSIQFKYEIYSDSKTNESIFRLSQITKGEYLIEYGSKTESLVAFFQDNIPTIWFADGSQLFGNIHVKPRSDAPILDRENIIPVNWDNVDIKKESQDIVPYVTDSIQYFFIQKIVHDFDLIYDDDGKGEIADIIGIKSLENVIDIHFFHLKYAYKGEIGNNIDNFYEVCGQALKSLKWKHKEAREFFDHLLRRKEKRQKGKSCSRLVKGNFDSLEQVFQEAKWEKSIKFSIHIVQPSLSKIAASQDILLLLGQVQHCLRTMGNIDLKVYSSQ